MKKNRTTKATVKEIKGKEEKEYYKEIKKQVEKDLKEIQDLIKWYEENKVIIKYKKGDRYVYSHNTQVLVDFYERCLNEREIILEYLLNGVKKRAKEKVQGEEFGLGGMISQWIEVIKDYPYRSITQDDWYFDWRKIRKCRHRLDTKDNGYIKQEALYAKSPKKFYKNLTDKFPVKEVFRQIDDYYIRILPRLKEREIAFNELNFTFSNQKWLAFSALAMLQIEGVFSEMSDVFYQTSNDKSLSSKVSKVRKQYESYQPLFDYFQYYLPIHRNSFLHTGKLEDKNKDFEVLAHDLLFDLLSILKLFSIVKDPLVEIKARINQLGKYPIHSVSDYNYIFSLKERIVKRKQFSEIKEEWDRYEKEILSGPTGLVEYFAYEIDIGLENEIQHMLKKMSKKFNVQPNTNIAAFLYKNADSIAEFLLEASAPTDSYERSIPYIYFLVYYKENLPNCPKECDRVFDNINAKHLKIFKSFVKVHEKYSRLLEGINYEVSKDASLIKFYE